MTVGSPKEITVGLIFWCTWMTAIETLAPRLHVRPTRKDREEHVVNLMRLVFMEQVSESNRGSPSTKFLVERLFIDHLSPKMTLSHPRGTLIITATLVEQPRSL